MAVQKNRQLVIVESPAKAKTIGQFLGGNYDVEASFGHVRDLPNTAAEIPTEVKKEKWSRLGVNVTAEFEPLYIVPAEKKKQVAKLRAALKEADGILLATDEDREGESISWHLLQVLEPPKSVKVERIVFHEITKEAITYAIAHPRSLDERLVRAQESRRILDRLYGYTLSPLLWKKVAPGLSAGRVQSVATRLSVERERQRRAFVVSNYADLTAELRAEKAGFKATLVRIGEKKLASGRSFDPWTGQMVEQRHLLLTEVEATALASRMLASRPWTVSKLEQTPGQERPVPPFTTSTLQQESNRKLRLSSKRTMQIAQSLYEGIEVSGERVGLITYMRTDSLTLSERAMHEARKVISDLYGNDYLPPAPIRYRTTAKNAQEAHEAIRPTDLARRPQDVKPFLDDDQYRLYEMIWKRTIACQMVPARVLRTSVEVSIQDMVFSSSGKQILFPGFLRAYVEGSDDPEAELEDKETLLPALKEGQVVTAESVTANQHATRPPARYTEASLVKKLEEEGIGRPSTYAAIISTIQDRGYISKRNNELVPTFAAFCVTEFLEKHFGDLVDIGFTSSMEQQLDEIADGKQNAIQYLREFYHGTGQNTGLVHRVEQEEARLDFPRIQVGEELESGLRVVVKMGRFGPYIQRGDGGPGNVASIPDDLAPADLTLEKARSILQEHSAGPVIVAVVPSTGEKISIHKGRFGDYLEITDENKPSDEETKPRRVTLPAGLSTSDVTEEIALQLASLPRKLGKHPETGAMVSTAIGRFGPYVKNGEEFRSLKDWRLACTITMAQAVEILKAPKQKRGAKTTEREVLRELPAEGAPTLKILDGRYGPYVTDGQTNASLPKGRVPEEVTREEALEWLAARAGKDTKAGKRKKGGSSKISVEEVNSKAPRAEPGSAKSSRSSSQAKPAGAVQPGAEAELSSKGAPKATSTAKAGSKTQTELVVAASAKNAPAVKNDSTVKNTPAAKAGSAKKPPHTAIPAGPMMISATKKSQARVAELMATEANAAKLNAAKLNVAETIATKATVVTAENPATSARPKVIVKKSGS